MSNMKGSVAAQYEQSIHFEPLYAFDDLIRYIDDYFLAILNHFACIGITAIRRAQNRTAARQDAAHIFNPKRDHALFIYEPVIPIAYPQYLTPILVDSGLHRGADDRIQSGRVTPACENTNSLHEFSPIRTN